MKNFRANLNIFLSWRRNLESYAWPDWSTNAFIDATIIDATMATGMGMGAGMGIGMSSAGIWVLVWF